MEHVSSALRTAGAGARGIDDGSRWGHSRHGGRETVRARGILSIEYVLEMLNARAGAAADIADVSGCVEDCWRGEAEAEGKGRPVPSGCLD